MAQPSPLNDIDYASLLCSRLCHDLLSPVGAIGNGFELLADEDDADMRREYLDLIEQSARTSADKLKFFRLAFGGGGSFGDTIPVREVREAVDALAAPKVAMRWAVDGDVLSRVGAKALLNLALVALEALVRGGTLELTVEGDEGEQLALRAIGPRVMLDATIVAALEGTLPAADLSSRTAPAWMTRVLIERTGGALSIAATADALALEADLPR